MRLRNLLLSTSFLLAPLMRLTDRFATDIDLQDYAADHRSPDRAGDAR
jgi:hypothetical protein